MSAHDVDMAEGTFVPSEDQMRNALSTVAQDSSLSADAKKQWSVRIKGFFAKLNSHNAVAL